MYVLYIIMFSTLMMTLSFGVNSPGEKPSIQPDVIAMQMASYHVAAQKKCLYEECVGGSVRPVDYMNESVKNSDFVSNGYFQSTYDSSSGHVVTSLTGVGMNAGELSNSTVSSSFHRLLAGGSSSGIGYWDRVANRVFLPNRNYGDGYILVGQSGSSELSATLFARVPDKSPVLINRVR